jgi:hypothetical protein
MRRLQWSGYVEPHQADRMSSPQIPPGAQAAGALLGVIICTKAFTSAARRMGWGTLAVGAALLIAGHLAARL